MTEKTKSEDKIELIPITKLHSSPMNARKKFNGDSIAELAADIRQNGLIQNPIVRIRTSISDPEKSVWYEIVAGERRFRALKIACQVKPSLSEVPCIVRDYTDEEVEIIQISENIHREELSAMEECNAYHRLFNYHKSIQRVSEVAGKDANYVRSRMQLKSLTKDLQKFLDDKTLPITQALIIAKLPEEQQKSLLKNHNVISIDKGKIEKIASADRLKKIIECEISIPINSATFDIKDKNLNPKMGACTECEYNTGCNTVLFADLTDESRCTKGSCFADKTFKHIAARVKQLKESGENVVMLFEQDYNYGELHKKINGYNTVASCKFVIWEKKTDGAILGIFVANDRWNSKFNIGQEVYLTEKPKEKRNQSSDSRKEIPADESPIEQRERRMKKRFEREDNLDKIEVRKQIATVISKEKNLSKSIIREAAESLLFTFRENNLLVFRKYGIELEGYENDETASLEDFKVDDEEIDKLLNKIKSESDLLQLIKCSVVTSHLELNNKTDVNLTDTKNDELIKIAKEYNVNIPAFMKPLVEARKKEREQELSDLSEAKKRAKEREKKLKKSSKAEQKSSNKKAAKK